LSERVKDLILARNDHRHVDDPTEALTFPFVFTRTKVAGKDTRRREEDSRGL